MKNLRKLQTLKKTLFVSIIVLEKTGHPSGINMNIKRMKEVEEAIGLEQYAKNISNDLNAFLKIVPFTNISTAQRRTNCRCSGECDWDETTT